MEVQDIFRSINELYDVLRIPPIVSTHMKRTAGVMRVLEQLWVGPPQDFDCLTAAMLLHDVGNIVKMRLDDANPLVPGGALDLAYWRQVQAETIAKYGGDDEVANLRILEELGVPSCVLEVLERKSLHDVESFGDSVDWALRLVTYVDMRVSPYGVCSITERFLEWQSRSASKHAREPSFSVMVRAALVNESLIFEHCKGSPASISDSAVDDLRVPL